MQLNEYQFIAKKINEHFQKLNPTNDPFKSVWLISVDSERHESKAGLMVSAYVGHTRQDKTPIVKDTFPACRLLAEGTHKLASDEEIEAHLAAQDKLRAKLRAEESARKVPYDIKVQSDPEFQKLVMAMAQKLLADKETEVKPEKKSK